MHEVAVTVDSEMTLYLHIFTNTYRVVCVDGAGYCKSIARYQVKDACIITLCNLNGVVRIN